MRIYQLMKVDKWSLPQHATKRLSLRFTWGKWAWSKSGRTGIAWFIRYCRNNNLPYLLHPLAGRHSPPIGRWIEVAPRKNSDATTIPIPWNREYHRAMQGWLGEIVDWIGDDPLWEGWHVPGLRDSSEMHCPPELKTDPHYSDDTLAKAFMWRINTMLRLTNRPLILDYSTIKGVSEKVLHYAEQRGVGVQHNALKASTRERWSTHRAVAEHIGPRGFQAAGGVKRSGDPHEMLAVAACAGAEWLELYPSQIEALA